MPDNALKLEPAQEAGRPATLRPIPGAPPAADVRRKKPPFLSFLLRMETLRRILRVGTLVAIDFAGVALALFTAL